MIELVSVVAILSIFAVIMIPRISNSIKTSRADQLEDVRADVINASIDEIGLIKYETSF